MAQEPKTSPGDLAETLMAMGREARRFARLTAHLPEEQVMSILFGWMGLDRLREMNDHLEQR